MNSTSDEEKRIQSSIAYELERSKEQGVLSFSTIAVPIRRVQPEELQAANTIRL